MRKTLQDTGNPLALQEYAQWWTMAQKGEEGELAWIRAVHYEFDDPQNWHLLGVRSSLERIPPLVQALSPREGELILDIGCGSGAISYRIAKAGAQCVALDINLRAMQLGRKLMGTMKVAPLPIWIQADGCLLPFRDGCFDKVVCADVWEHLRPPQKRQLLLEVVRVLKPGGTFVLTTPNALRVALGLVKWKIWALVHGQNPKHIKAAWSSGEGGHIGLDTPKQFLNFLQQAFGKGVRIVPTVTFLRSRRRIEDFKLISFICRIFPFCIFYYLLAFLRFGKNPILNGTATGGCVS